MIDSRLSDVVNEVHSDLLSNVERRWRFQIIVWIVVSIRLHSRSQVRITLSMSGSIVGVNEPLVDVDLIKLFAQRHRHCLQIRLHVESLLGLFFLVQNGNHLYEEVVEKHVSKFFRVYFY